MLSPFNTCQKLQICKYTCRDTACITITKEVIAEELCGVIDRRTCVDNAPVRLFILSDEGAIHRGRQFDKF